MDRFVRFSVDRPWTTIALLCVVTLFFGLFLPRIQLDTDPKNMLAKSAPVRVANAKVEQHFALSPNTIVVGVVSEEGIFRPETLGRLFHLTSVMLAVDGVVARDVASLSTTNNVLSTADNLEIRPSLRVPPTSAAEADAIRVEVQANPLFVDRLVSRDGKAAAIYVPFKSGADGSRVAEGIRRAIAKMGMPEKVYLAGDPIVSETMAVEVFRQLGTFSPLAGLLMFVVLLAIFRNLPMVIAVMIVSMVSTVWAMGLHIALGLTVHLMSAMIPVFLMAIATDSIHIFNELGFRLRGGAAKRDAILQSMDVVGRPVIFSDLTAAAGFAALASSTFPAIRMFGIFVAIGTLGILILSFTLIPALLSLSNEKRLRAGAARAVPHSATSRPVLAAFGRFAVARSAAVGIAGMALLAVAAFGMTRIRINNNMVHWFSAASTVRTADAALNDRLGGTCLGYVVLTGPDGFFKQPEGLRFLEGLEGELSALPKVGKTVSVADAVKQTFAVLKGSADQRKVPDSEEAIAQILLLIGSGGRPQDLDNFLDYSQGSANVFVQLKTWDVDAMQRVITTSQSYLSRHPVQGLRIEPAGIAYFNLVWTHEMLDGMLSSFLWGLALVLLLLVWEYRSLRIGALAFVPLLFTTPIIYGALGIIGKDFDMPISVLSTLTLGLAIDFAIHFVSRLRRRLAEPDAGTLDDALRWTIERPGLGIVRNAVVFSVGFIVMAFAGFSPYITVGILMATIMLLSSLATLLYLPALFKLFPAVVRARSRTAPVAATLVFATIFLLAGAARAADPSAEDVAQKEQIAYYYPGRDFRAKVTMKLVTKGGDVRERQLVMLRKNWGAAGGEQRYLTYFQKPDDVRRTSFLVWKYPQKDDDRWLFLPAVDLVRRIAASDRRSSFVGSDFTYEDISGRDLGADTRKLLPREKLQDSDCFVIESTPSADAEYGRRVSWIDGQTFLPRKEEYYDRQGQLFKVFTSDAIQVIKGFPTITRRTMKDVTTGHLTTVEMAGIDYDIGLDDDIFTERFLRRPPTRWISE